MPLFTICAISTPEVAPPGFGFVTVTGTLPTCATAAVPVAVNSVGETKTVVNTCPPKFTVAPLTNLLPVTVSKNPPTPMLFGLIPVKTGIGFCKVTALVPCFVASAALVAAMVIVIVFGFGSVAGAVYNPCGVIIPVAAEPPATPFTDQVTP